MYLNMESILYTPKFNFSVWIIMISEGFYRTQKASPLFVIHGHPCISVTCWSCQCTACPHVSAHVTVRRHMRPKWRKGEEETLPPCPLIVWSSPTLWEYPCIPGNRGGEGQRPLSHALAPDSGVCRLLLYCYIVVGLHHRCHDVSLCCSLILLFIISPHVCYASSLCLIRTTTPSSFPPPGTFSSVYSPKLSFLTR